MSADSERAHLTYAAMQRYLQVPDGHGLYREAYPFTGGNPYAYVWPFARALVGTLTLAGVADDLGAELEDRLAGLAQYWNGQAFASYVLPPFGQGGDTYYDDNVWIGLALVELSHLGRLPGVQRAQQVLDLGRSAWHRQAREPIPGGVFWVEQGRGQGRTNHDRGAGLTAGYAKLGLLLESVGGAGAAARRVGWLDSLVGAGQAARSVSWFEMLDWVDASPDSGGDGVGPYWNALRRDGSVDTNVWSYVQGEMLGARTLQYRVRGDHRALERAEGIARQTLATFGDFTSQPPPFNAMCFQNLLLLYSATSNSALQSDVRRIIQHYADWAWDANTGARDPRTNLFTFTSAGAPAHGTRHPAALQDQGAMLQIYALLAWDPANYAKLT